MATSYHTVQFSGEDLAACITAANAWLVTNSTAVIVGISAVMLSGNEFTIVVAYSTP